jgi:hypothetical protein
MAIVGWVRLKYGFNFIDEGMYMTDGWRLTVGDRLFPDSAMSAVMPYVFLNALVFKIFPSITLLHFRELQFFFALTSIGVFGAAIYKWCCASQKNWKPWILFLSLSVFAMTGLETIGTSHNLTYYTYPQFFLVLHLSFLLFALTSPKGRARSIFFIGSGIALWLIGFSNLPLSAAMISPVLIYFLFKPLSGRKAPFTFKELLLILSPGIVLWVGFIAIYNLDFLRTLSKIFSTYSNREKFKFKINAIALQYIATTFIFCSALIFLRKLSRAGMLAVTAILSITMFFFVYNNWWGLISPYWNDWFSIQMWVCSLIITFIVFFTASLFYKKRKRLDLGKYDPLILIILIPCTVFAVLFSFFSGMGILATLYCAIPVTVVLSLFLVQELEKPLAGDQNFSALFLVVFFIPFFYHYA